MGSSGRLSAIAPPTSVRRPPSGLGAFGSPRPSRTKVVSADPSPSPSPSPRRDDGLGVTRRELPDGVPTPPVGVVHLVGLLRMTRLDADADADADGPPACPSSRDDDDDGPAANPATPGKRALGGKMHSTGG